MIVDVALPIPVAKNFSYSVPTKWHPYVRPFSRVVVPFRMRVLTGVVTDIREGDKAGLKDIREVADLFPLVGNTLRELTGWASRYYVTPMGLVLKYALPPHKDIERYLTVRMEDEGLGLPGVPMKKAIASLGRDGLFERYHSGLLPVHDVFGEHPFMPSPDEGPTGGETDNRLYIGGIDDRLAYYVSLISDQLARGRNVLMLLPDYYRTGSYFSRAFLQRFPGQVFWYGAAVKAKSRMETYFTLRNGGANLLLGTKSAVFLPVKDLGLVIVERHEEDHYRNEKDFSFNAAAVAAHRATIEGVPAVLGSPSPSMEVMKEVEDGTFNIVSGPAPGPRDYSETILAKGITSYHGLPDELIEIMKQPIERNERIAIYTPRKDYGSYIECLECKTAFSCPLCGGILSYQKSTDTLICAGCGRKAPYEEKCPACGSELIRFSRAGAEYLEEQVRLLFPHVPVVRVTGDTPRKEIEALIKVPTGAPLVIVGTQALSNIYGIGVASLILTGWEELARISGYRAHEKMFHLLMHLLDTLNPEELHFCMERKKKVNPALFLDVAGFCGDEMARRKIAEFPPFTRFFLIEVEKKTEATGLKAVDKIREFLHKEGLSGGITGPLFQKKEHYQWRMILKGAGEPLYETLLKLYEIRDLRIEADPLYL